MKELIEDEERPLKRKIRKFKKMLEGENVETLASVLVNLISKDCEKNGTSLEDLRTILESRDKAIKYAEFSKLIKVLGN